MIGTATIDAEQAPEQLDFSGADHWHVLVLAGRQPAARVDLPSPGALAGGALTAAALSRRADAERARGALIERLRGRLGAAPERAAEPLRVSVVVCTHRRSHYLPDLLAGLRRLDPAPLETIVVDNDPGAEDCRELVAQAGFRYVREDRRGLDNARNAGLHAARGDVVLFTDDDCVPPPGWLAPLPRTFAHEGVAAVTGPAFPYLLDTPARVRMEHQASLARGLARVAFDWQSISPLHAAAMGVGANMAIRRPRLLELGPEPFPPELDAGTESESGGDTYVLSRLLAAGERVVYEPQLFTFHQHRPDGPALHRALYGYGIGLSAALTKLVVEEGELTAPRAWIWLVRQYVRTQRRRAVGRADAIETRLSWDYLRGGFLGAPRWRRALRTQRELGPASHARAEPDAAGAANGAVAPLAAPLAVSVIVPTFRREAALERCLRALTAQDAAPGSFEVIVVDDDVEATPQSGELAARWAHPLPLRRVHSGGLGAAGARNVGARAAAAPLLLFLDDDVVADPWLVRTHCAWHAGHDGRAALVGAYRPRPTRLTFASAIARLWWQDLFHLLDDAIGTTFVAALTANLSLARALFDELGGFSEEFSRQRREDWEWGLRALRAGVEIAFDPHASARHELTLTTAQRLRDARREGSGDVLIAARYPEALASLPLLHSRPPTPRAPLRWIGFCLWRTEPARRAIVGMLDLLERGRLRGAWLRLFRLAQNAAYAQGAHDGGWRPGAAASAHVPMLELELMSEQPVPAPAIAAPLVRVTLRGEEVARVAPAEGVWGPALAEQVADALAPAAVARAAAWGGWLGERAVATPSARSDDVDVIAAPDERDPGHRWDAMLAAARASERPLVALPLPGTEPGPAWLEEALAAFDGERVGLAFGGALEDDDPTEPLYLHDRRSADASLTLAGRAPAYLVLRRELAVALEPTGDLLGPVIAAIRRALDDGWVIGHRDVHGLRHPAYGPAQRGEAYGREEAGRLRSAGGRVLTAAAGRGLLVLGWHALKQRGRLSSAQRALAAGVARGAAAKLHGR